MNAKILAASSILVGATLATSAAHAQDDRGAATAGPVPSTAATPIAAKVEDNSPDHERFIGHFAVGYFGISQIPIATPSTGGGAVPTEGFVTAPIIGGRYWLQRNLGIDAGIGIGYQTSSTTTVTGNTTTKTDLPSMFGFALHGGVPIAFAEGHHYTFELVPEATFGFASGSIKGSTVDGNTVADTSLSGFRLDIGARVGAEIHFGFIGVPELALEGSVGLYVRHQSWKESQDGNSGSGSTTSFATSVGSDPWAIFVNNISALYYF